MDTIFILKLLLSFLIGGSWVILSTVFADKFGSKIGGLITGLPSTVIFSLLFLAWTQSPHFAVQATTVSPISFGIGTLFVLSYIILVKKNIWTALIVSFLIWFILAIALVLINFNNYSLSLISYLISFIIFFISVEYILKIKSIKGKKIIFTSKNIFLRGFLSGFIIAIAVIMGKIGGPIFGGIFSGFPAVFTSTMLITYFSQGADFSIATMKSSALSIVSGVIYSIVVRFTYIPLGILYGTILAIAISLLNGVLVYKLIVVRLK